MPKGTSTQVENQKRKKRLWWVKLQYDVYVCARMRASLSLSIYVCARPKCGVLTFAMQSLQPLWLQIWRSLMISSVEVVLLLHFSDKVRRSHRHSRSDPPAPLRRHSPQFAVTLFIEASKRVSPEIDERLRLKNQNYKTGSPLGEGK